MKAKIFWLWGFGLVLAVLPLIPLAGGSGQDSTNSVPPAGSPTNVAAATTNTPTTVMELSNAASPEEAEQELENAPGEIVSAAKTPANIAVSAPVAEIVRLAQAGVDESVMLAYVTNSSYIFKLTSEEIIYLSDVGVPSSVVTAMIQRDEALKGISPNSSIASIPPANTNQLVPTPYSTAEVANTAESQPSTVIVDTAPPAQANVSYTYFQDSLAPYGNWVNISGYGLCWQPTVAVANRGWRPYCDRGRWVYSDCGWYWASDYSWGWAPFHYGRWFSHSRFGWCWAPDTVWAPSWVSWRYTRDHCSWAPLPPTACYTPGFGFSYYGRSVGFNFTFGLSARHFTCVPLHRFSDRHLDRHRISDGHTRTIVNNTVVNNTIVQRNRTLANEGVPVDRVAAATRSEIRRVNIRNAGDPESARGGRGDSDGRTLPVFRPDLPTPTRQTALVGQGIRPASRQDVRRIETARVSTSERVRGNAVDRTRANNNNSDSDLSRRPIESGDGNPRDRRPEAASRTRNQPVNPVQSEARPGNPSRERSPQTIPIFRNPTAQTQNEQRPDSSPRPDNSPRDNRAASRPPLIMRGPDRSNPSGNDRNVVVPNQQPNANRAPVFNQAPPQQAPPTQNIPQRTVPQRPPPSQQQPRSQYSPPQFQGQREQPRQEVQRSRQQEVREWVQSAVPAQRQAPAPNYQAPRFEPRSEHRPSNPAPAPQRNTPSRSESPSPAPRVESQQSVQSAPPSQRNVSASGNQSSGNQSSRQDGGGGNGRRNR